MNLRHYLFEHQLKAMQFSKIIGVHSTTIYQIMSGQRQVSIELAQKIEEETDGNVSRFELPMSKENLQILRRSFEGNKKIKH